MADLLSINFPEQASYALVDNCFTGDPITGQWRRSTITEFYARIGITPTIGGSLTTFAGDVTAGNFILSSDFRLKENIKPIGGDFVTFNMKGDNQKRVGVIAQELEKKHPQFVRTNEAGMKSVAYLDFLSFKIAELEARLNKYEV